MRSSRPSSVQAMTACTAKKTKKVDALHGVIPFCPRNLRGGVFCLCDAAGKAIQHLVVFPRDFIMLERLIYFSAYGEAVVFCSDLGYCLHELLESFHFFILSGLWPIWRSPEDVRRGLTFFYFWVILITVFLELPGFRFLGAGLFLFVFSIVAVIFISIFILGAPFVFPS